MRVYGSDGRLTEAAIVWLARRIWWGEASEETGITTDRRDPMCWVKRAPLALWWTADRWPLWWPWATWVVLGDRVQLRLVAAPDGAYAEVRRPRR